MRCLVRCLMYVIYVTAVPRGFNQDRGPKCRHCYRNHNKHISRLGTKVVFSTLIQTVLIFVQVLASVISCYTTRHGLVHLFFCWVQKGPPGLHCLFHGIWSKNTWHRKWENISGTWELKENQICTSCLMKISNDSKWGSRRVSCIILDKYTTPTH